jgi:hypothetical protein
MESQTLTVKTGPDGSVTVYTSTLKGPLKAIAYEKVDYENTVDIAITATTTGQNLFTKENVTASTRICPGVQQHDSAGTVLLYSAGMGYVPTCYFLAKESIKIAITNGGANKTGRFTFVVG